MCIFCGGTCGGVGDMLLPSIVTAGSLVVMRVRMGRHGPESGSEEVSAEEGGEEPASPETREEPAD